MTVMPAIRILGLAAVALLISGCRRADLSIIFHEEPLYVRVNEYKIKLTYLKVSNTEKLYTATIQTLPAHSTLCYQFEGEHPVVVDLDNTNTSDSPALIVTRKEVFGEPIPTVISK